MKKLFYVGQNKCGTSTIARRFRAEGVSSNHSTEWVRAIKARSFIGQPIGGFKCYCDGPTHLLSQSDVIHLMAHHDCHFIVQYRELRDWLVSRWNHVVREFPMRKSDTPTVKSWAFERQFQNVRMVGLQSLAPHRVTFMHFTDAIHTVPQMAAQVSGTAKGAVAASSGQVNANVHSQSDGYNPNPEPVAECWEELGIIDQGDAGPLFTSRCSMEEMKQEVVKRLPKEYRPELQQDALLSIGIAALESGHVPA